MVWGNSQAMAEELEVLWKKLSFTEEEDEGIEIDSSSTRTAKEVGKNCALMKVISHKSISLDALRKNLRMLWKANRNVQISEVEDELFLVEFSDWKDKQRVLDMRPWSYEKQLVILQEFDDESSPKDIELKWVPFWVQIFNLPLKCRTKDIGWAIGSKLGEVLEVNVSDSRVQWARCLRVRVNIDVTKRLVRGKKITVEGGEGRWVQFKYERLPNFCYRCGLLSHALKDCRESRGNNSVGEKEELQYGAWLRGEIFRRYSQDSSKRGMEKEADNSFCESGDEIGRRPGSILARGSSKVVGTDDVPNLEVLEPCPLPLRETGIDAVKQKQKSLHENGMVKGLVKKAGEKEAILDETALVQPNAQSGVAEKMLWETAMSHANTPPSNSALAPSQDFNKEGDSPISSSTEPDFLIKDLALGFGGSTENIGPNGGYSAKEISASSSSGPNRKVNPSPRGGRIRNKDKSITRNNKGKSVSQVGLKRDARVAFKEEGDCGGGKRQAVEDVSVQTAAAGAQPRRHQ